MTFFKNPYGSDETIEIDVIKGKEYFVKLGFGETKSSPTGVPVYPVHGDSSNYLVQMSPEIGITEIKECKLSKGAKAAE